MKEYKAKIVAVLSKDFSVSASSEEEAKDLIYDMCFKTDAIIFDEDDVQLVVPAIVGIESSDDDFDDDDENENCEDDEDDFEDIDLEICKHCIGSKNNICERYRRYMENQNNS